MDSWDSITPSPDIKLEASPAESNLSASVGDFSSLFAVTTTGAPSGSTPACEDLDDFKKPVSFRSLTPQSACQDDDRDDTPSGSPEKKTKKRKSWGQVLPEPKTNLPPRKRAKTEDEKEQRRVERVLRNRRAAQSSRERKRLEVEALERRTKQLEAELQAVQKENFILMQKLTQAQGQSPVVGMRKDPVVTFSQELFSSQNGHSQLLDGAKAPMARFIATPQGPATINPVSLSPTLEPVPDHSTPVEELSQQETLQQSMSQSASEQTQQTKQTAQPQAVSVAAADNKTAPAAPTTPATAAQLGPSPDETQRPAATLCHDLQCPLAEVSQAWKAPQTWVPAKTALYTQLTTLLILSSAVISVCSRPMTQIAMSLKAGFSIPPTPAILNSIIWLITRPSRRSSAWTSTSTTSSTRTAQTSRPAAHPMPATFPSSRPTRPITSLRLKVLRKILTSNPILARPLADATMRVLRLACSEKPLDVVRDGEGPGAASVEAWRQSTTGIAPDGSWLNPAMLPSKEALLTLLWALRVEEIKAERSSSNKPGLQKQWALNQKNSQRGKKRGLDVSEIGEAEAQTFPRRRRRD